MQSPLNKKVLLAVNTSKMVLSFRKDLIKKFQIEGFSVGVVALDSVYEQQIRQLDVEFFCVNDDNRSLSPFKILSLKKKYCKIIEQFNPSIVMTFMLKPNVFCTRAAKKCGVERIFSMVEGAGQAFLHQTLKWKIIRQVICSLYKKSFKHVNKVFFLNTDDRAEFIKRKLVKEDKVEIVRGIGVNLERFAFKPITNFKTFIMVARLTKEKGVFEYCETARAVKKKYPDAIFNYLGGEGAVKIADIKEYIDDKSINYLGETDNVIPYLEQSTAFVLPSYREGLPMSVMEAQSIGRLVITSNCIGCRDTVVEGYNGFLVKTKDVNALAEKIIYIIENKEKAIQLGENARAFAQENFDQNKINQTLFDFAVKQ
ncbi:MAG: glycosyltransferase family 4 protein [Clostridia bacterium]|nr:glycosyltransferase family 4 protein [Clostridia bacterium]